ncbi:MAG TPA: acyl carrier protein [Blastocatellia bacterium]|nr:acyl carrier protein [Blastocatellia bacterium]
MGELSFERIKEVLADVFSISPEQIKLDSTPDTIETWDSIHHVNMVIALEQEFGIGFSPEEIEQLFSVERVWRLTSEKVYEEGRR